ncbi:MAG: hypothetical protein OEU49_06150 [Chromatiales bacterium]|nr:hypothetical protein [Chromatiales bacterium]MDH4030410.1 hypothetical protein [Chromatiales bacterium]
MREINLQVTIDEANLILEGLGQMPFARVYALVAKLQEQAAQQLKEDDSTAKVSKLKPASSAAEG